MGIHTVIKLHSCGFKPVVILWKAIICLKSLSSWNDKRSLIRAFATLFFLSFMKLMGAVCDSEFAAYVVNVQCQVVTTVSYIDPTVVLFSHHHIPVVALSVAILIFVHLPPTILLMLSLLPESQHTPQHEMATETKNIHRHILRKLQGRH